MKKTSKNLIISSTASIIYKIDDVFTSDNNQQLDVFLVYNKAFNNEYYMTRYNQIKTINKNNIPSFVRVCVFVKNDEDIYRCDFSNDGRKKENF